jgi:hypothetical protein
MASQAGQARAKKRAAADRGPALTITVDGEVYSLVLKDMTALDVRALRAETGYSYNALARQAAADMDIDLLAAVVWMARRINGERDLTYDEVAAGIDYTADYTADSAAPDPPQATVGADDSPEA